LIPRGGDGGVAGVGGKTKNGRLVRVTPVHLPLRLYSLFLLLPPAVRFFVSGTVGNVLFFKLNSVCDSIPFVQRRPGSMPGFLMSYMLTIPAQHLLNGILVFGVGSITAGRGASIKGYARSLSLTYSTYSVMMVATTLVKGYLSDVLKLSRGTSFLISVYGAGVVNFFILSAIAKRTKANALRDNKKQQQRDRI